jgi:hypothetical protein
MIIECEAGLRGLEFSTSSPATYRGTLQIRRTCPNFVEYEGRYMEEFEVEETFYKEQDRQDSYTVEII